LKPPEGGKTVFQVAGRFSLALGAVHMQQEASRAGLTIRIEGIFDVPAARRVRELLDAAPETDTVSVDLSHVREFRDPGVAVLAEALSGPAASRVAVRGLRQHQIRMLRYLGVALEALGGPDRGAVSDLLPSA
jgi:hypothetical protein